MLSTHPLLASLFLSLSLETTAAPQTNNTAAGLSMPLKRRSPPERTVEEWGVWAKSRRLGLEAKYGNKQHDNYKRATGTNLFVSHPFISQFVS